MSNITIRNWTLNDVGQVQVLWLDYYRRAARADMKLRRDAGSAMTEWLSDRFRNARSFGFIAESEEVFCGFLLGRIDDWESVPPVIESRRIGIIDAVYVADPFRRQGVGTQLIDRGLEKIRASKAVAVETAYEAWNDAPARVWHRAGFAPWVVHAYRML
jgi:GNAT superfamily N-acetyltransferase